LQITAQFIPDVYITNQHLSIYIGKRCSYFLIICLIVGRLVSCDALICHIREPARASEILVFWLLEGSVQPRGTNNVFPRVQAGTLVLMQGQQHAVSSTPKMKFL
jgi:hypothetical protein